MPWSIGPYPRAKLVHLRETRSRWYLVAVSYTQTYSTYSIDVRRPAHGRALARIHCADCRRDFDLFVVSARRTRWARAAWLVLAAVSAVLAVVLFSAVVAQDDPAAWVLVCGVTGFVAAMGGLCAGLIYCWLEEGVRWGRRVGRHRLRHSIRELGSSSDQDLLWTRSVDR